MTSSAAQMAVIGAAVLYDDCRTKVIAELEPADFDSDECRVLYEQILDLNQKYGRLDSVIATEVENKELLVKCCETLPSKSGIDAYIRGVKEAAASAKANSIALGLAVPELSAEDIEAAADQLMQLVSGKQHVVAQNATQGMLAFMQQQKSGTPLRFSTGWNCLDDVLQIRPAQYIVIGARPSGGKTNCAIQMSLTMAKTHKVVFYSLETSCEGIWETAFICKGRLLADDVRNCRYDIESEEAQLILDCISNLQMEVVEAGGRTVQWIALDAQRRKADIIIIDYIQLLPGAPNQSSYEVTTLNSKELHTMAQRTKICVIALSQLSRAGETDEPQLTHLRESGQIEQDADAVILLHNDKERGTYMMRVAKNKKGRVGDLRYFTYDMDHQYIQEDQ